MKGLSFGLHGGLAFAAVALLSGCGGGPFALGQAQGDTARGDGALLPMARAAMPAGRKSTLIYAANEETGGVDVFDYSSGRIVQTLTGLEADAGCVDAKGDVYIVEPSGIVVKFAHGGTTPLTTYRTGGDLVGCSVDSEGDLAVTASSPGRVTVYEKGNPQRTKSYDNSDCEITSAFGYDDKGDVIGLGSYNSVFICAVLRGAKAETTLEGSGITVKAPNGSMWDGKYLELGDQEAGADNAQTGMIQATLSGKALTAKNEVILADSCYRGYVDVRNPFVVGKKNTPVNDRQGKVVVGANLYCFSSGSGGIEFWHYPQGGSPFRMFTTTDEVTVLAVSIGT
ncbi:MAG TPA: hypothetical protein VKR56_02905 [Candidatus Cybelea sp.]|nr:hypothetical protein [Candidatus Cybelea sp.]